jgi:hypothetical protein
VEYTVRPIVDVASKIVEEVEATLHVVLAGIEYVFDGAVSLLEEAVTAATGIFAHFGVALEKLRRWLEFLFAWDDIWATAVALDASAQSVVTGLESLLSEARGLSATWFGDQRKALSAKITETKAAVSGWSMGQSAKDPFADLLAAGASGDAGANPFERAVPGCGAESSWLTSILTGAGPDLVSPPGPLAAAPKLEEVLTSVTGQIDTSSVTQPLTDFMDRIGDDTGSFLGDAIGAVLDTVGKLLDVGLQLADAVVQKAIDIASGLLEWLRQLLQAPITIPLLVDLYESSIRPAGNDEPLTLSRMFSLVLAVPITIAYKFLFDVAPYPARVETAPGPGGAASSVGGQPEAAAGRPSPEVFSFFVVGTVFMPIDAAFDLLAWDKNRNPGDPVRLELFVLAGIVFPVIMQGLSMPKFDRTISDAVWATKCAAPLLGCLAIALTASRTSWTPTTWRFKGPRTLDWGITGLVISAVVVWFLSIARVSAQRDASAAAWAAAAVPPLSGMAKFLLWWPDPEGAVALAIIDAGADLSGASLYYYLHTPASVGQLPTTQPR